MIIAIDFDGCISPNGHWPGVAEEPLDLCKAVLSQLHYTGHYLIINTCRVGIALINAKNFLLSHKIPFNRINQNAPGAIAKYGADSRKIFADIYIDDNSLYAPRIFTWEGVYERILEIERIANAK